MKFQCFSLFSLLEFDSPFVLFCFPFEAAEIKKKKPKRKKPNQVLILSGVFLLFFFCSFFPLLRKMGVMQSLLQSLGEGWPFYLTRPWRSCGGEREKASVVSHVGKGSMRCIHPWVLLVSVLWVGWG